MGRGSMFITATKVDRWWADNMTIASRLVVEEAF